MDKGFELMEQSGGRDTSEEPTVIFQESGDESQPRKLVIMTVIITII